MKTETGWLAAALVTALGFGIHSFQSTPAPALSGGEQGVGSPFQGHAPQTRAVTANPPATSPAATVFLNGPCAPLEEQLQTFFDTTSMAGPDSCFPEGYTPRLDIVALPNETSAMHFAIAVLPDPLHTHFSLTFDRYAAAIQEGAQDNGYVYDSSWLPWETKESTYTRLVDKLAAEDQTKAQEEQPGIILFRKQPPYDDSASDAPYGPYCRGLAIFVVGEEATAGVNRKQFQNALLWIDLLNGRKDDALKIIGPSFRGSLPSLKQMLDGATYPVNVFSGGVTGKDSVNEFLAGEKNFTFQGFQQSDDDQIDNYCHYLRDAGTLNVDHVAIISEDETAFGYAIPHQVLCDSPSGKNFIRLFYPRDISALRAAYQSQSLLTTTNAAASPDVARHTLKTDLADPEGNQHDTIRSYSGAQSALSQESELQQIVRMLKSHQSQYVILRSSNPLDQIFLTKYLQQEYPQGRIVVASADLLLAHDIDAGGIGGVMTLSNYPLIPTGQDWSGSAPVAHTHRSFTNSETEATYVATSVMLGTAKPDGAGQFAPAFCLSDEDFAKLGIRDYSEPFWVSNPHDASNRPCHRPPTWIAVLGRGGFWPVAAIDVTEEAPSQCDRICGVVQSILFLRVFREHHSSAELSARGLGIPLSLTVTLALIFLWSGFHLWCCSNPTVTHKPGFFAHFARSPYSPRRAKAHLALMIVGSTIIGSVPSIVGWGMGTHSAGMEISVDITPHRLLLALVWVLGLCSVAANVWIEARLEKMAAEKPPRDHPVSFIECVRPTGKQRIRAIWLAVRKPCGIYVLATFLVHTVLVVCLESRLYQYNRVPTYIRSMNITSGVSPIAPLLIIIAGLYCWFWFTLQGQAVLGDDRPLLPRGEDLQLVLPGKEKEHDMLSMLSRELVAEPIEGWCDWVSGDVGITFAIAFAAVVVAFVVVEFPPLRSLGSSTYSGLCFTLIVLCAAMLLTNMWQLLRIWFRLRQLLLTLDRLPLRRSIYALRGFSWGSIWTMGGNVLDERYKLYSRQGECLIHLEQSLVKLAPHSPKDADILRAKTEIDKIDEVIKKRIDFWVWYAQHWSDWGARDLISIQRKVQEASAEIAGKLIVDVLYPVWILEKDSAIADRSSEAHKGECFTVDDIPAHILAAEEFVCLVYMGFIQNVLGRVRSMVSGIIFLFVALALGMTSYPFDPRPLLNAFVILLFAVLGFFIFTVYAQMHRDATLSRLTNTNPGELGTEFWLKLIGFGVGPVFSLLAIVFPAVSNFFFSWMQPGLSSLK